ncbi:homocysteine S-methyltransferase [Gemmatimonas sp.]|uniref:homocysteine S-methyltransferase n=1 Tax=Gemmatimonas sp. TaxID=1962908 RepID=UPI003341F2A1
MPHPTTGPLVLDGGLATELAARGYDLSDALWSARLLADAPEAIEAVHRAYFEAGANVAITASYQASFEGFAARGYSHSDTVRLLQQSVTLAQAARDHVAASASAPARDMWVAASVGPYGATLHDGSEYRGNYGLTEDALVAFHRPRMEALLGAGPDLLACETLPSLLEARAVVRVLREFPQARAWVTFSCRDGAHTSAGDAIAECAQMLHAEPQVVAMGVNCVDPVLVTPLVRTMAAETSKPIVVYPNSGELWNAAARCWEGSATRFTGYLHEWIDAGATWIGGCCRTTPEDIRVVRAVVDGG